MLKKDQNCGTTILLWLGNSGIWFQVVRFCLPDYFLRPPSFLIIYRSQKGNKIVRIFGIKLPMYHHCPEYLNKFLCTWICKFPAHSWQVRQIHSSDDGPWSLSQKSGSQFNDTWACKCILEVCVWALTLM
jgi:hypothetical protein